MRQHQQTVIGNPEWKNRQSENTRAESESKTVGYQSWKYGDNVLSRTEQEEH